MHYLPNLYLIKIFRRTFSLTCNSYGLTLPNPWPTCIPATHCAGSAITNYLFKIRMYLCFYVKMYCPLLFSNVSFCPKVIDIGRKGNVVDRSLSSYIKRQPGMLTASRQRLLFIIPLDMKRSCTLARPRRPSSLAGAKKGRSCSFHSHLCLQVISDDLPPSSSLKSSSPPS